MDKVLLTLGFLGGGLLVLGGFLLLATWGDRKWAARRERMRLATPYKPPLNSRPLDFDKHGRTW
jgi:hypothetical protein